jgi:hypothetical protein
VAGTQQTLLIPPFKRSSGHHTSDGLPAAPYSKLLRLDMRRLVRFTAVLASLTAFIATAQSQQSRPAHPDAASHTEARSQIEAMTPQPASAALPASAASAAASATAKPRDPYAVSSGKHLTNRQKLARFSTQHKDSTAASNASNPYQYDGWNSKALYSSPESAAPGTAN